MQIQELAYQSNSAELFQRFAHLPYAIFLDSCQPYQAHGRFDIFSAQPKKILLTEGKLTKIIENGRTHTCTENPFDITKNLLEQLPEDRLSSHTHLPLLQGAMGYFAYDIGHQLEKIELKSSHDVNLPTAFVGFYSWHIIVDHLLKQTWLITQNNQDQHWVKQQLITIPKHNAFLLQNKFQSNMDQQKYAKAFAQVKQHIFCGDCYEVNLCHRFSADYQGSPWQAYQLLRKKNPAPYAAYINLPQGQIMCFSPERFLQVRDRKVETKPIKGTALRFSDPQQDQLSANKLKHSEKDRSENLMIVDLLRNDLGKCCRAGSIKVPKLFALESFSNVHHLVSTIIGELEPNQHGLDLLRHCFPGGSITGAPKIRVIQIIEELEPHHRSIYCGTIGYFDKNFNMDTNIVIRTLLCAQNKIHCYSGGAIVHDSLCDEEYQETLDKVGVLIRALEDNFSKGKKRDV